MKRVDIKTGFLCNNNCRFCVQAHNKAKGNRTFDAIKKDLEDSKERCDGVVFTGGEIALRDDLVKLVSLAKQLDYKVIQIQTNGRAFSSLAFCEEAIKAGTTEFFLSLHGYCSLQHDFLTGSPGSFKQTVKGIINLKSLGAYVLTNTVVVKSNYRDISKIARLLVNLNVDQFQFAFVHAIGNAGKSFESTVPVISLAAPHIHTGLQIGIGAGKRVMAEAMPYCVMQGYEEYIAEKIIPFTEIKSGFQTDSDYKKTRMTKGKAKFSQCKKCKYDAVCEGPWREYPEKFGSEEFQPVRDGRCVKEKSLL